MSKMTINFPDGDEMIIVNPGKLFEDWPQDFDGDLAVNLRYEEDEESEDNDE